MRSALDILAEELPKESGGSCASNRLGYQKDWTFCLLLKLHVKQDDYLVVCDYHDDVLVMDDSQSPDRIHFYQVKTNSTKRWTITDLIHREKGKKTKLPSMLGKLYRHSLSFDDATGTLNFVANLPINVVLPDKPPVQDRPSFTTKELGPADLKRIEESLREELGLYANPVLDIAIVFHLDNMSTQGHETFAVGELAKYLEKRDPSRGYPAHAIYKAIFSEIEQRMNIERPCTTVVDVKELKAISRADFEGFLLRCLEDAHCRDYNAVVAEFQTDLTHEQVAFGRRQTLVKKMGKYALERLDSSKRDIRDCAMQAGEFVAKHLPGHSGTLLQLMELGASTLVQSGWNRNFENDELMIIVAWEALIYGRKFSTANQNIAEANS